MNSIKYMSNYGGLKKRIIFAFVEYFLSFVFSASIAEFIIILTVVLSYC